jgi:hypothetical protein
VAILGHGIPTALPIGLQMDFGTPGTKLKGVSFRARQIQSIPIYSLYDLP